MPPSPRVRETSEAAILITVPPFEVFAAPVLVARWNEKMPDSDCPRTVTVTGLATVPICASSDPGENLTSIAIPLPKLMSLLGRSKPTVALMSPLMPALEIVNGVTVVPCVMHRPIAPVAAAVPVGHGAVLEPAEPRNMLRLVIDSEITPALSEKLKLPEIDWPRIVRVMLLPLIATPGASTTVFTVWLTPVVLSWSDMFADSDAMPG